MFFKTLDCSGEDNRRTQEENNGHGFSTQAERQNVQFIGEFEEDNGDEDQSLWRKVAIDGIELGK